MKNSSKKKQLSRLLVALGVVSFIVTAIVISVLNNRDVRAFSGSGDGTQYNPFRITTCEQLQEMHDHLTSIFVLSNSIDCSGTIAWGSYSDASGFRPIGHQGSTFSGTLDGNNFTISGLYSRTTWSGSTSCRGVGLFESIYNATIKNIRLEGADMVATGLVHSGGIAGCAGDSTIQNVVITNSTVEGGEAVGGIVGQATTGDGGTSLIENSSYSGGTVVGHFNGGIAGYFYGHSTNPNTSDAVIRNVYVNTILEAGNINSYAGGIVSEAQFATIENAYSTGTYTTTGTTAVVGGIASTLQGVSDRYLKINNSFSTLDVSLVTGTAGATVGGIVGSMDATPSWDNIDISNNYFDGYAMFARKEGDPYPAAYATAACFGSSAGYVATNCTQVNDETNTDPNYFLGNSASAPLDQWNFSNLWQVNSSALPTLILAATPTAPGIPTNVIFTTDGTNASGSWLAPADDGGVSILDYHIQYRIGPDDWADLDRTPSPDPLQEITNLTQGQNYAIRVASVNAVGISSWVEVPIFILPSVQTNPATSISDADAVLGGDVTDSGNSSLSSRGFEYGTTQTYGSTYIDTAPTQYQNDRTYQFNVMSNGLYYETLFRDIAFATDGSSYTYDSQSQVLHHFAKDGTPLDRQALDTSNIDLNGTLAIDSNDTIYLSSLNTSTPVIFKFSLDGAPQGQFNLPQDSAQSAKSIVVNPTNGDIYIATYNAVTVYRYSSDGTLIGNYDTAGLIADITVDSSGNVLILGQNYPYSVEKLSPDGISLATIPIVLTSGSLTPTSSIAVDNVDQIYIINKSKLYEFEYDGTPIRESNINSVSVPFRAAPQYYDHTSLMIDSENSMYMVRDFYDPYISPLQKFPAPARFLVGDYENEISGLACSTTYYFRAFAENQYGVTYGSGESFTTQSCPTTATANASNISNTSAQLNGNISFVKSQQSNVVGFEYGTTASYGRTISQYQNPSFSKVIGSYGTGNGQFRYPTLIDQDNNGNFFVTDIRNENISKFDSEWKFIKQWGNHPGYPSGPPHRGDGITIDDEGYVYQSDEDYRWVQKFDNDGNFIKRWGGPGATGEYVMQQPNCPTIGPDGNIYVVDTGLGEIKVFNTEGEYVRKWGSKGYGNGQFDRPACIVFDENDIAYVNDTTLNKIQKFNSDGTYISSFAGPGESVGKLFYPTGLAIKDNLLYVSDSFNNRVQIFTTDGEFVATWNASNDTGLSLYLPTGIFVAQSGKIYVVDGGSSAQSNGRIVELKGFTATTYSSFATDLECNTTYHYRSLFTVNGTTKYGNDTTFKTASCDTVQTPTGNGTPTPNTPTTPTSPITPPATPTTPPTEPDPEDPVLLTPFGAPKNATTSGISALEPGQTDKTKKSRLAVFVEFSTRLFRKAPNGFADIFPWLLILILIALAIKYGRDARKQYQLNKTLLDTAHRSEQTKTSTDAYLSITAHYLNTPVSILKNGIELMISLKELSATAAKQLQLKIEKLALDIQKTTTDSQALAAATSSDEGQEVLSSSTKKASLLKGVVLPVSMVALILLILTLVFFQKDNVSNNSLRVILIWVIYFLSCSAVLLSFVIRNKARQAEAIAHQAVSLQETLLAQRRDFIASALRTLSGNSSDLQLSSDGIKPLPHAQAYMHGLDMLGSIITSLANAKLFASPRPSVTAPLDVSHTIENLVQKFDSKAKAKQLGLSADIKPQLKALLLPEELEQLINSIVDNAIKFAPEDGLVDVRAYSQGKRLIISVTDNGNGIAKDKLENLFKPFSRGTSTEIYDYEGLGLSLYVDKILIERIGGSLQLVSSDKGTQAIISIPKY